MSRTERDLIASLPVGQLVREYRDMCLELASALMSPGPNGMHAQDCFEHAMIDLESVIDLYRNEIDSRPLRHIPHYDIFFVLELGKMRDEGYRAEDELMAY